MCTVTFIPLEDSVCFASLRDESPVRPVASLSKNRIENEVKYLAPIDGLAGGTWIGVNELGTVVVLLNGGFDKHNRQEPYKKSRGIIVKELLLKSMPVLEWSEMDLENIEPFTLIVWSSGALHQLVWDGLNKHNISIDHTLPHLWSSSTLYDTEAKIKRRNLFNQWMSLHPRVDQQSLLDFFRTYANGEDTFIMDRENKVKTISYTFVALPCHQQAVLQYYDLQNLRLTQDVLEIVQERMSGSFKKYEL